MAHAGKYKKSDYKFLAALLRKKMISGQEYSAKELSLNTFYEPKDIAEIIRYGQIRYNNICDYITIIEVSSSNRMNCKYIKTC